MLTCRYEIWSKEKVEYYTKVFAKSNWKELAFTEERLPKGTYDKEK